MSNKMRVVFNQGQILVFEVQECTGARVDRLICNIQDNNQGMKIIRLLQEKYGFLEGWEFVQKDQENKPKKFLDFD